MKHVHLISTSGGVWIAITELNELNGTKNAEFQL